MEQTSTALATRNQMNEIANVDPTTAWLYVGGKRLAINNDTRNGFVVKAGGEAVEEISELHAQITNATSLHSHRQPGEKDKDKPRHADAVEWCESNDNKQTSTNGYQCAECPAMADCKWKIELTMQLADREDEYKLTIPTASAMRFKQAVQKLAQVYHRHFTQALWRMWVTVERSNGNAFPVVNYEVFDLEGNELPLDAKPTNGNGHSALTQAPTPAAPTITKTLQPRQPAKSLAVAKDFMANWRTWCIDLASEEPYFNDKNAPAGVINPDAHHIRGTIAKLGFSEIYAGNAGEIRFMLLEYARNAREEQTAK